MPDGVKKVVLPVAFPHERLLPITKALPAEMLPLGRLPAIQHVVEEMTAGCLAKFLFVNSPGSTIIQDLFDNNIGMAFRSHQNLENEDLINIDYARHGLEFFYARLQVQRGTTRSLYAGAAIATAEGFVDNEHFVVACPDTIVKSVRRPDLVSRMLESHLKHNATCTVGVCVVPSRMVGPYGIVQPAPGEDVEADCFRIERIGKKHNPDHASRHATLIGRFIFGPQIFDEIYGLATTPNCEIDITYAIRGLISSGHPVRGVKMRPDETRYDIGDHESYFKAFVDFALEEPNFGEAIRDYVATYNSKPTG